MTQMLQDKSGRMVTKEERLHQLGVYEKPEDVDRDILELENQLEAKKKIKTDMVEKKEVKKESRNTKDSK